MYSIFNELHPPTVVDHAVVCNFFSDAEQNLVTAGASKIIVYRLYTVDEIEEQKASVGLITADGRIKKRLEQMAEYSLFGNVLNMKSVRLTSGNRDSLLLSFKEAKLSLVEYDPESHELKTNSMHLFENEEFKSGLTQNVHPPLVRVDPEQRCACMLVYGRHLVVLPFRQDSHVEDADANDETEHVHLVSPSYMVDIGSLDHPVANVCDMQFLHGYQEPTLMLLSEPVQTCAGRVAVRQDTYSVSAISLNMKEKVHPIIWNVNNLPFDCFMLKPVQKPLGGVLVFANNSLIYLNQSTPPYGVSLNSMTMPSTMFPLRNQENIVITLAEAVCDFISVDKLIISLKGGEIYVMTMLTDGLRSMRSFHFDKSAGSVLASCLVAVEDGFVFLGSRLGNSLLLRYTDRNSVIPGITVKEESCDGPASKKRKINDADEEADLEIFGDSIDQDDNSVVAYSFEVADSVVNMGPITKCAVGEPAFLSEEFVSSKRLDLELVCCSGCGKNGALSVLQRSIRPQVVTTFELPGCHDMWTVRAPSASEDVEVTMSTGGAARGYHSFLILSRDDSTMVLRTGDEITEIETGGFNVQYPTVFAGNLGADKYIVQVCPMSVRLLEGSRQLQDIPMDSGADCVSFACLADPHVVMVTADGSLIYASLSQDVTNDSASLVLNKPNMHKMSKITSVSLYQDTSGLFTTESEPDQTRARRRSSSNSATPALKKSESKSLRIEDEDDLLYGDSSILDETEEQLELSRVRKSSAWSARARVTSYWCVVVRESGALEIYSVPDFRLVFVVNAFNNAAKILIDSGSISNTPIMPSECAVAASEVLLVGLGHQHRRPYLYAMLDQDLIIYECYPYHKHQISGHLGIRFKRVEHNLLMRVKEETKLAEMANKNHDRKIKVAALRTIENVSTYSRGVFVCGAVPHWIFVTSRGTLNGHPMTIDGAVSSFASFHNVNCPNGFLYFNQQDELRIAVLPSHLSYDSSWAVRKVPLKMTPYEIVYAAEQKVYAVACAYAEVHKKIPRFHTEEREFDTVEREPRFISPTMDRFVLQLISPTNWEIIPGTKTVLEEFEHVTCMKMLNLSCEMVEAGVKPYLVVGTTFNYGEDLACKGRTLIFDILEVVPEPGQPLTKTKYKCLHEDEQKGPVSAIAATAGYLIVACGQKIYAFSFKNNSDLVGVAFVDAQVTTVSLFCMKNMIVAADIRRSISLIRFQVEHKSLALVSRDPKPLEVYTGEFYVDEPTLGFMVSDSEQNILIFMYQPEALESFGGHMLLLRADFNAGCHINCMFRVTVCQETPGGLVQLAGKVNDKRQATYMPSLDGSISLILPMNERSYRRLLTLQAKLVDCLPHRAGLNPRQFRALSVPLRPLTNPSRGILDGTLLSKYAHLNFQERYELAKKMGTTPAQILDDLMDAERATSHF